MLRVFKSPAFFDLKQLNWLESKKCFYSQMEKNNFFENYEKLRHRNIIKTEYFLKFNPKLLSHYRFEQHRFHFDSEGNLMLFNNKIRRNTISEIAGSNDDLLYITGPRGVGKSHIMALLVLYS